MHHRQVPHHFDYLIIAGGQTPPLAVVKKLREYCQKVITVDRGAETAMRAGIQTDLHVGDNDSVSLATLKRIPRDMRRTLPRKKSISDLEYAVHILPPRSTKMIVGAHRDLQGRSDHVLVNFLLAAKHPETWLIDPRMWIYNVGGRDFQFSVPRGTTFSVLAFDRKPVTISGAEYDLRGKSLPHPSMGLSNRSKKKVVRVQARGPALLFVESSFLSLLSGLQPR